MGEPVDCLRESHKFVRKSLILGEILYLEDSFLLEWNVPCLGKVLYLEGSHLLLGIILFLESSPMIGVMVVVCLEGYSSVVDRSSAWGKSPLHEGNSRLWGKSSSWKAIICLGCFSGDRLLLGRNVLCLVGKSAVLGKVLCFLRWTRFGGQSLS